MVQNPKKTLQGLLLLSRLLVAPAMKVKSAFRIHKVFIKLGQLKHFFVNFIHRQYNNSTPSSHFTKIFIPKH